MRKDNTIRTIRNGEFIMAYMHIPREYLSRCGAELNSIPRCLKDLLYDERALAIVESDLFLEAIIDVYAYLVWPHMGYKEAQMEIFSGDAPEWRYAHAAPMPATRTSISSAAPTTRKTTAAPARPDIISGRMLWSRL
jgi:hypothetical protein